MPLYMTQFSYTSEAWASLLKNPEDRFALLERLVEEMGGRLISAYYCFGEYDGVLIYEHSDNTTAMAGVLAAIAPGHVKATKTTVLFAIEDALEAIGEASELTYRGPEQ
ncbi:MAG: hypothetical protein MAG451_02059 [Anaerolineales bacterium]|nr:hypothetical protein [Anaerolineales bacterium]